MSTLNREFESGGRGSERLFVAVHGVGLASGTAATATAATTTATGA